MTDTSNSGQLSPSAVDLATMEALRRRIRELEAKNIDLEMMATRAHPSHKDDMGPPVPASPARSLITGPASANMAAARSLMGYKSVAPAPLTELSTIPPVTEAATHMLSHLVASSYAPPMPANLYDEPREDEDYEEFADEVATSPELLVEIVDCQDKMTNGTFAWVGSGNGRPFYRLLGPEPRYLYYAEVDPTWAGWWVADKMGSEDYVEWFKDSGPGSMLPVMCGKGEFGSRVVTTRISEEVVQRIALISNYYEKTTIRTKFTDVYGEKVLKCESKHLGLRSKTPAAVGIAHALEAQQQAIQMLHGQIAAETQRREAAEAHAQTMEEAFETLQLRISVQLPHVQTMPQLQAPLHPKVA